MKLHTHRPTISNALQVVSGVIPSRTTKEILRNVRLQVSGGNATLMATDLDVAVRYELPGVEIEKEGEALLPAARTMSILREMTDDGVLVDANKEGLTIRAGQSVFNLAAEDPAEFPAVAAFEDEKYLAISAPRLREAIRRTVFATDSESTRYALSGVLCDLKADSIALVATDSRRLAVVELPCRIQGNWEPEGNMPVIPAKAMSLIERILADSGDEDEVFLAIHPNDAVMKYAHSTISCRLVDGRFPKYSDVIPKEISRTVELVSGPFHAAVRQAQIVTNEESRGVDFSFSAGSLSLSSRAAEIGESKVDIPVGYDGDPLSITFDPRFVAEFLRVLEPEKQLRLELINEEAAAVFRTDDNYAYVIMPLSRERAAAKAT